MDEPIEELAELEENMEEQEVVLQEDLDFFRFKDSSFLFTTDEMYEEGQFLLEDDACQDNVVQASSQLTKTPLKESK
jgi:hypothetical protein